MTWEEIIIQIRKDPAYKELVKLAYFDEDLTLNVTRFQASEEFAATVQYIRQYTQATALPLRIADIGAGNGIAAVAFALMGFDVTAVEPDPSDTVGAGAIRELKAHYNLSNLNVVEAFAEEMPISSDYFDVVYIRQAVHHACNLNQFMHEASRLLRKGGILITARDHVVYNDADKTWFLQVHPLHKFYGGENAYTEAEYTSAINNAGFSIIEILRHYDSVINYFPESTSTISEKRAARQAYVESNFQRRIPLLFRTWSSVRSWYFNRAERQLGPVLDAKKIPGRLISFIAQK